MTAFDLIEHVRGLAPDQGGLVAGERLVVALSGGADSVALLDVAQTLGVDVVAAHLDHALRRESADDAAFCRALCAERGIPCVVERVDVGARAAETGAGVEAAGREARYAFFEAVRSAHGADRIATAHHLDDHVESVMLSLGRGTGLRGLRGIAAIQGRVVRPLRRVRRRLLRLHLQKKKISWREDPSNTDPDRRRNQVRADVLPALEEIFGATAFDHIGSMGERADEDLQTLDLLVSDRLNEMTRESSDGMLVLDRGAFLDAPEPVRSALLRAAARRLFTDPAHQKWNAEHVANVLAFVQRAHTGRRWSLPGRGILAIERDRLILKTTSDEYAVDGAEIIRPERARLVSELLPGSGQGCSFSEPLRAFVDASRVRPPFVLRSISPGDRMQPHGMDGRKKVVTLLSEHGVPRERRARQLVVCDRERIVWAPGLTTCHRARVEAGSRWVWQLRIEAPGGVPSGPSDAYSG